LFERRAAASPAGFANTLGALLAQARENRVVEVWPENAQAFWLFVDLRSQWRMGPGGPTGLDYLVLYRELDERGFAGEAREQLKADIREMERAALGALYDD
jgi:hypothetical protein